MARGPSPALEGISSGLRSRFINNEKYIYEKFADLAKCNIPETTAFRKMSGPRTVV